jgi:ABC-type Na+ efflux pump permease subunit
MKKFLAVVKHEYKKNRSQWTFLIATLLFPIVSAGFAIVPALLFSIKGEPTRLVIVDQNGKIEGRIRENLLSDRAEKIKEGDEETAKNFPDAQDEQMKRAAEQLGESFNFVEYDAREKSIDQIQTRIERQKLPRKSSTHI